MQVSSKIYFSLKDGMVLTITAEMQGDIVKTTKENDMKIYEQLKDKNIDEVDYIELKYGTLSSAFTNAKSYKVNLETKQLEVVYYTKEELEEQRKQYEQKNQDIDNRVNDISSYLANSDEDSITKIENHILETEKNKILNKNGGM